jgi:3-deoxy-D-manno-octulosonic-acid transferase
VQLCLAQSLEDCNFLQNLGGTNVKYVGNLKCGLLPFFLNYDIAAPPTMTVNPETLSELSEMFRGRAIWLASSTHPNEEKSEIIAKIQF